MFKDMKDSITRNHNILFLSDIITRSMFKVIKGNMTILQTNKPRVFHVKTTWKRLWNTRGVFVGLCALINENSRRLASFFSPTG